MKLLVSVVMFFLLLNCFATAQTLIRDSCKTAAAKDPNLKYDFCVQSLEQDPQSKTATTLSGLVLASTNNAASKAINVKGIVETILKNKNYPPGTENASANVHLSAALDEPSTCEDGFKEKHAISPVTNENNILFQKILIPLAFTNML
ncbi:hypothetical protein Bca52824_036202 [Brassica carinata]|uniref:Pectinesterase inhibitor domain-containing protein n=1 Tax=Brassica carinata TaxID=52824 RepID=A0A8X7V1D1_BRACI|nr:hypothetical protein Bca52824_036202 [Brassica carinata]